MACANGLVVRTATVGSVRLVHSGLNLENVFTAARSLVDRAPQVAEIVRGWSGMMLSPEQQMEMASRMATARWGERLVGADLLTPRRGEDTRSDLWTSFNRAQEAVIRGGMGVTLRRPITLDDGTTSEAISTRKATAIRGALKQMRLNQELFSIASDYAWN
jgi:hypothetical protein